MSIPICTSWEKAYTFRDKLNIWTNFQLQKGLNFVDRKDVKKAVFQVLFTDNRFIAQETAKPKRIFKELFPEGTFHSKNGYLFLTEEGKDQIEHTFRNYNTYQSFELSKNIDKFNLNSDVM